MALQLEKELPSGVIANYWRITNINNQVGGKTVVELSLYLSDESRLAGKNFLEQKYFEFEIDKQVFIDGNVFEVIYTLISQQVGWELAIDC